MFCPKTCPTPSSNSMIENWTCSLRRVSKRRSGEAERHRAIQTVERASSTGKSSRKGRVEVATVSLRRGQVNAVRAAFKAGIKPSRIARQFGISQSDLKKMLASDDAVRGGR
jgi:hypothetical protein